MFRSILVPLAGTASDAIALNAAYAFGHEFDAHIDALHIRPDPASIAIRTAGAFELGAGAPGLLTAPMMESIQSGIASLAQAARHNFDRFVADRGVTIAISPGPQQRVTASFADVEGDFRRALASAARAHSVTVCARSDNDSGLDADPLNDLLVHAGRPLLLAPSRAPERLGRRIAIAWNDTPESARAVAAAMPLISVSKAVAIVTAPEGTKTTEAVTASADRLSEQLRWQGITIETRCVEPFPSAAHSVIDDIVAWGADLLVMGGYGHSRAREFILGGFTRTVLAGAPLAVFLTH